MRRAAFPTISANIPSDIPTINEIEAPLQAAFYTQEDFPGINHLYVNGDTGLDSNPGTRALPLRSLSASALFPTIPPNTYVHIDRFSGYYFVPNGGMVMIGGTNQPCIVSGQTGYPKPVIDALPYSISGHFPPDNAADIRVRQIFDTSGPTCRINWLDLRHGFRHCVVLRGPYNMLTNCDLDGAFEDAIKVTAPVETPRIADYGLVRGNDAQGYASGGIDLVYAGYWLLKGNRFHNPIPDPVTGQFVAIGVGMKGGCPGVVVSQNLIENIPGDITHGAIELGAGGIQFEITTTDCIATDNIIRNFGGPSVVASCVTRPGIYRNIATDALIGIQIGLDEDVHLTVPTPNTTYASIGANVISTRSNGAFQRLSSAADGVGYYSRRNIYTGPNLFVRQAIPCNWTDFKAFSGSDSKSILNEK